MITSTCIGKMGRLGNQMFQVAAVIGYAHKHNTSYSINWTYAKDFKSEFKSGKDRVTYTYKEKDFTYDPIPAKSQINIEGYFQSEKYFEGTDIKSLFEPCEHIENIIEEMYGELLKEETVSIHVRRGDYLNLSDYHYNLSSDYYNSAISYMLDKPRRFIFFSDDIQWCKETFYIPGAIYITGNKDIIDLFLMSKCKHNIIANSSFSWWASYLNKNPDKKVIAPTKDKWFGKLMNKSVDDLYLDNWILI